jgi:hypothetical protein
MSTQKKLLSLSAVLLLLGVTSIHLTSAKAIGRARPTEFASRSFASLAVVDTKNTCTDAYFAGISSVSSGLTCNFADDKTGNAEGSVLVKYVPAVNGADGKVVQAESLSINYTKTDCHCDTAYTAPITDLDHIAEEVKDQFVQLRKEHKTTTADAPVDSGSGESLSISQSCPSTDSSGRHIDAGIQMNCRIDLMDHMNDALARSHFHRNIEAMIKEGLASGNAYEYQVAMNAVNRLRGSAKFETLVKESLADGLHNRENQLISEIQNMSTWDPRRAQLMSELQQLNQHDISLGLGNTNPNVANLLNNLNTNNNINQFANNQGNPGLNNWNQQSPFANPALAQLALTNPALAQLALTNPALAQLAMSNPALAQIALANGGINPLTINGGFNPLTANGAYGPQWNTRFAMPGGGLNSPWGASGLTAQPNYNSALGYQNFGNPAIAPYLNNGLRMPVTPLTAGSPGLYNGLPSSAGWGVAPQYASYNPSYASYSPYTTGLSTPYYGGGNPTYASYIGGGASAIPSYSTLGVRPITSLGGYGSLGGAPAIAPWPLLSGSDLRFSWLYA